MFLNCLTWLSTAQRSTSPPFLLTVLKSSSGIAQLQYPLMGINSIFVLCQPVDWLIHECHMFPYFRYIVQTPLSKTTTVQLKDSTCKVIPREVEPHGEPHINFWEVCHGTNMARKRFCCIFWNWPHLHAFVIEHCAPGCNCEWFLQCTRTVC